MFEARGSDGPAAYLNEHEAVLNAIAAARCVWEWYEKERLGREF
jgi:hypothetical protein